MAILRPDAGRQANQMTASSAEQIEREDEVAAGTGQRQMRLDQPHGRAASEAIRPVDSSADGNVHAIAEGLLEVEEPTPEMVAAVAGELLEAQREQMQLQVAQLANHLRERLREVDRREAAVNARVAQLEADLRNSRLWLRERELTFQARERELEQQILELREKGHEPAVNTDVPTPLDGFDPIACLGEIAQREQRLQAREDELRERRFELNQQSAALAHAQDVWRQQREHEEQQLIAQRERIARVTAAEKDQATRDCELLAAQREEQLCTAEEIVAEQVRQLEQERTALADERKYWEQQRTRQQQALDELRASTEAELAQRRARLDARQDWVERQKAGLDQVREEALALHRQALETRLLGEQLWSQINGALATAEVSEAVAQLKSKLAEQYRLEEKLLVARRDELLQLSEKVATQHRDLTQFKDGVRQWAFARQADLERQAQSLAVREQKLDAQETEMHQAQQRWHVERRDYQRQIAELKNAIETMPAVGQ
jgi:hypothetical protein